jgi:hypothetical protein
MPNERPVPVIRLAHRAAEKVCAFLVEEGWLVWSDDAGRMVPQTREMLVARYLEMYDRLIADPSLTVEMSFGALAYRYEMGVIGLPTIGFGVASGWVPETLP